MSDISIDLRLSEHFVLREFTKSDTARRLHIDNSPRWCHVARLISLCEHVLEPLRREFGPIVINSGYRCEALNRAVGGVRGSQHVLGEAADVRCRNAAYAQKMYDFIRQSLVFDQVILEGNRHSGSIWVHVSYRKDETANRHQAFRMSVAANAAPYPAPLASHPALATHTCRRCGRTLPIAKFNRLPSGNVRNVCNHCRWVYTIQPSRNRSILRMMNA